MRGLTPRVPRNPRVRYSDMYLLSDLLELHRDSRRIIDSSNYFIRRRSRKFSVLLMEQAAFFFRR